MYVDRRVSHAHKHNWQHLCKLCNLYLSILHYNFHLNIHLQIKALILELSLTK